MRTIVSVAALAAMVIGVQPSSSAPAGPTPMTWTDSGQRGGGPITFTAASPLCSSGTVRDIGGLVGIKMVHTCADGSGTFEFETAGLDRFHFTAGGTGRYATLRGTGSCSVTQNDDGSFTRPCHALADFDNTPPSARFTSVRPSRAGHSYRLRVTFQTRDDVAGNAVSYRLSATAAGHALAHVKGTTPGGLVKASLNMKLPKHTRRVVVSLKVTDPLENSRTVSRSASVPR